MGATAGPIPQRVGSAATPGEAPRRGAGIELAHKILLAGLSNCAASNGQSFISSLLEPIPNEIAVE